MRCPFCAAPAAPGTVYRDIDFREYRAREYQCGRPYGSPEDACGAVFRVHIAGPCTGVDDVCLVVGDDTFCRSHGGQAEAWVEW